MRKGRNFVLGAVAVVAAMLVAVPTAIAQSPRVGANYRLVTGQAARGHDVPGLAVDPANPSHIVEANSNPVTLNCEYRVSFDGGLTWAGGQLTTRNSGDVPAFPTPACDQNFDSGGYAHFNTGIVFGSGQNVYIAYSVHRGPFNRPESNVDGGFGDDAVVARSTDGGKTFAPAVKAVDGGGSVAIPGDAGLAGFGMRPQLAVQRGAGTAGADKLYIATWHCHIRVRASSTSRGGCSGGGGDRRIFVARSDDAGATWTPRVLASAANVRSTTPLGVGQPSPAQEAGSADEQAREPSQPVVGPDGTIYVAYRNRDITNGTTCPANPAITTNAGIFAGNANFPAGNPTGFPANLAHCVVIARSSDGGANWVQRSTNQPIGSGTLTNPRLAIDPTAGATGKLYVVYQRAITNNTDTDISIQTSTDKGDTWSAAVRVNDDPGTSTQANPNVAVGPAGRVDVIWSDKRHPYPGGNVVDTYMAQSATGGASFAANRRITDRTINTDVGWYNELGAGGSSGGSWYGPVALPLPDGSILAAWADSREGSIDSAFQDIYLSRVSAPTATIPTSTITAATTPGLSVRLSRLAYPGGTEALGDRGGEPVSRVVVANEGEVDAALAGAVLARARYGPLLFSPAAGLPAIVKAEAARMEPQGAYVLGGESSLSPAVASGLASITRGGEDVVRLASPLNVAANNQSAELARRVAENMAPLPGATPEAVIANPKTPEAVTAAALAAGLRLPILFADERTTAPAPTTNAISALGIKKVLIVGSTASVPAGVQTQMNTLLGAANVVRLAGADVYGTSEAVLTEAVNRGLPSNVVYVADGSRPMDAATLGAAVGRLNGLMLLRPGADLASAETRLAALGISARVDRMVGARGTGGSDPTIPVTPPPPPPPPPPPGAAPPPPPPVITAPRIAGCPTSRTPRNLILLTNNSETRNGTALADLIVAGAGNDVVNGLAGNDCIDLGPGNDRGTGSSGADFLQGGIGNDRLLGSAGSDILRGDRGNDRLEGSTGNDSLSGGSGTDTLVGGSGNDALNGGAGADRISGGSGRDRISARDGRRDRISCGTGRDRVTADREDRVSRDCESVRRA